MFLWGAIASVACALAYFPLLQTGSAVIIILAFILITNTAHDAQYATEASYFSEMFPTRIRYSGISISAQLGGVFAGAFAPLIATALLDVSGIWLVTVYFTAMCSISAIAAYLSPETYKADFIGQPDRAERRERFVRKPRDRARDGRRMTWKPTTDPVVITCALTGGIHGKEANPNLPEQPDEIVEQGVAAWRAGAAVLHVHARNPDGSNTMDPEIYAELHERLCAETDAVVQLTTGGSPRLSVEERITTVRLAPEMCSLNMGLLNFFIRGEQVFFPNHRSDIERFAHEIRERDVRPELEVYSVAMLEEVEHLLWLEILEPPYAINFVLHTPTQGGQRGTPRNLVRRGRAPARPARRPGRPARDRHVDGRRPSCRSPRSGSRWASTSASGWRTTCCSAAASRWRTTPSSSSGRCGSPTSSTGGPRRRTRRASSSA